MLPTEIGMEVSEVIKNNTKLESYISNERKIDGKLYEIKDILKGAYKSDNSSILDYKNVQISNSEFAKIRNLRSYKQYVDKYIYAYKEAGAKASEDFRQTAHKLKNK